MFTDTVHAQKHLEYKRREMLIIYFHFCLTTGGEVGIFLGSEI